MEPNHLSRGSGTNATQQTRGAWQHPTSIPVNYVDLAHRFALFPTSGSTVATQARQCQIWRECRQTLVAIFCQNALCCWKSCHLEYAVHAMTVCPFMPYIFWLVSKGRLKQLRNPRYGRPKFLKLSEFQVWMSLGSPGRPTALSKGRATFSDLFLWLNNEKVGIRFCWKTSVVCQRGFLTNKQRDNKLQKSVKK